MAITVENSDIYTNQVALKPNNRDVYGSELLVIEWEHTQGAADGDDGSSILMAAIPDGSRVQLSLSNVIFEAYGVARTLDFGWLAYTDKTGATVGADPNGLCDGIDVSAAGEARLINAPTSAVRSKLFDAKGDVVITATVTGGTLPIGTVTSGVLYCTRG